MSEALFTAVSILTDWRTVRTFRCRSFVRTGGEEAEYDLHAEPNHSSYRCVARGSGRLFSYDDVMRERVTAGRVEQVLAYQLHVEAMPARLAFPLSLGVWGRRGDSFTMIGAVTSGDELHVDLVSVSGSRRAGRLVVDVPRRLAVELDTPELGLRLRGIELASNEFWPQRQGPASTPLE